MALRVVSVKVNEQKSPQVTSVSYDTSVNVKVDNNQDYKVKQNINLGVDKLRNLNDVQITALANGDVVIYNSDLDRFSVKKFTSQDIDITNIDAGTF